MNKFPTFGVTREPFEILEACSQCHQAWKSYAILQKANRNSLCALSNGAV